MDTKYWSINPAKDTITFSKDFLATLANGEQTFTVTTAGGSCEVVITVTGEAGNNDQNTDTNNGDNQDAPGNGWIWIVVAGVAVVAAVVIVVTIRKKNGK
jgi:hypothetical protein